MTQHSKIISDHPQSTRSIYNNENSEKIRRALRHNIRTSNDNIFVTGVSVYYKRASARRRRRPAKVLAKDGQQVLVKHSSTYFRCHPYRLSLEQSNQHQQSSQAQTASRNNSNSGSDINTLGITEPPRQTLTATKSNLTSLDSENEHTKVIMKP